MERITIKDVAREAGVSASAVSRVFTDGGSASAETRAKVLAAADRLGYRPSLLARGLVGNRTGLVTLVTGELANPFDALFLERFAAALAERAMQLLLITARTGAENEDALLQALDYRSDAVVVAAGTITPAHSELCVRAGLPVILSGRMLKARGVDCVLADNAEGGRLAAELLLRTGLRRLAFLGLGGATFADSERCDGFAEAARKAGAGISIHRLEGSAEGSAMAAATELLSAATPPDGIFCSNDSIAIAAIEATRALHFSIPEALSIVGFNDVAMAGWRSFRLTTIAYPVEQLVSAIVALLESRLSQPSRPDEVRRIPVRLVPRATTRQIPPS
jgi:DNA-binding LacI/PurR family transcriptional regulator